MFEAIENILPRNQNEGKKELEKMSNILDRAIDFGTHLLQWKSEKPELREENLVPILFFRNILETADAISILIKSSSVDPAKNLIRTLLENVFALEYLLETKSKERSLAYIVWLAHNDLKFCEKMDSETQRGKQFTSEIGKDKIVSKINSQEEQIALAKQNSEELLKLTIYAPIEAEYQRTIAVRRNPNWFTLFDGPSDIEKLAKHLNHHALYEVVYRSLSNNVHGNDVFKSKLLKGENGNTDIIQIRYPKDAQSVIVQAINFLLLIYMEILKKELPERRVEFNIWYNDFRIDNKLLLEKDFFSTKP
jgi:hypothetical protein